jgi:hypothetical protein
MATNETTTTSNRGRELNPDPLTGEPGSHPVGTGIGAAAGGATGAAIGAVGGPIGAAVGAVIGAVAGGFAGKGVAEMVDPTAEDAYWRENHRQQPYAAEERSFDDYAPAYRTGYSGYREGKSFDEAEADLRMQYEGGPQRSGEEASAERRDPAVNPGTMPGGSQPNPLRWDDAREAARAAYERVHRGQAERVRPQSGTQPNAD